MRLSTYALTERFVRFQDPSFHDAVRAPTLALSEHVTFLRTNDRYNEVMASRQLHDLLRAMQGHFWWAPGRYEVEFQIRSPHRAKVRERKFAFTLTQAEVDRLRSNLELLRDDLEDMARLGEDGYQVHNPQWQWVNASLQQA